MSSIGSNPISELTASRAVALSEAQSTPVAATTAPAIATAAPAAAATPATPAPVVVSTSLSAGPAPINTDRVAEIKKAIATNSYPLIPAKIGDAMIAAGMLLGTKA